MAVVGGANRKKKLGHFGKGLIPRFWEGVSVDLLLVVLICRKMKRNSCRLPF